MKTLDFYDVVEKVNFSSNKYTKKKKRKSNGVMMYYAITTAPSGTKSSRILSKSDYNKK